IHRSQRTDADGAIGVQPAVSMVRWAEHGRYGLGCDRVHENRARLLKADVAKQFFSLVVAEAKALDLMWDEHFTVDGTLLEACASLKSFKEVDGPQRIHPRIRAIRR